MSKESVQIVFDKFIELNRDKVEKTDVGIRFIAAKHYVTFPVNIIDDITVAGYLNNEAKRLNNFGYSYILFEESITKTPILDFNDFRYKRL